MRKKIALSAILVALIALAGYGTYANMVASAKAHNVITAGSVKIQLSEKSENPQKASEGIKVMPATKASQEVTVKNIGKNDCFVRIRLEPKIVLAVEEHINYEKLTADQSQDKMISLSVSSAHWVKDDSEQIYYYNKKLKPDQAVTLPIRIRFSDRIGNAYKNATFNLNVFAEAVQADNNNFDTVSGSVLDVKGWPTVASASPEVK